MAPLDVVSTPASHDGVVEKKPIDDKPETSETGSTHKQEGVRQVEAIIRVWSKQVLIVMFIL